MAAHTFNRKHANTRTLTATDTRTQTRTHAHAPSFFHGIGGCGGCARGRAHKRYKSANLSCCTDKRRERVHTYAGEDCDLACLCSRWKHVRKQDEMTEMGKTLCKQERTNCESKTNKQDRSKVHSLLYVLRESVHGRRHSKSHRRLISQELRVRVARAHQSGLLHCGKRRQTRESREISREAEWE